MQSYQPTGITTCSFWHGDELLGIQREKYNRKLRSTIIPADTYRDFKTSSILRAQERHITKNKDDEFRGPAEEKRIRKEVLRDFTKKDAKGRNKIQELFFNAESDAEKSKGDYFNMPGGKRMIAQDYDKQLFNKKERTFLYIGDDQGYLKCLDVTHIIKKAKIKKETMTHKEKMKSNYTPNRCEGIEITSFVSCSLRE